MYKQETNEAGNNNKQNLDKKQRKKET